MSDRLQLSKNDDDRLKAAVLRVLQAAHVGRQQAVTHKDLTDHLRAHGFRGLKERTVRQAIEDLRNQDDDGALICAASGAGVYFAATLQEVHEFTQNELRARARTMLATARRQRQAANRKFGGQARLF